MTAGESSDEELCGLVQIGDRVAADQLIKRYRPLVYKLAKSANPPPQIELDDVAQIGHLALYSAAKKWRSDRGAKFKTVAYCYVGRAVRRYVKEETTRNRPDQSGTGDVLAGCAARELTPSTVANHLAQLDQDQAAVIRMTFGMDGTPIGPVLAGRKIGKTRKQVQRLLASAIERLKLLAAQPE